MVDALLGFFIFEEKRSNFCFAFFSPKATHEKNQPIRSSRLVGEGDHIYECLVLLYGLFLIPFFKIEYRHASF